jgi:maltose alpha-D-glucosyltransferase/alpha-amylase
MFRSFSYAIYSIIFNHEDEHSKTQEAHFELAELLYDQMVGVFLHTYIDNVQSHNLNIGYRKEIEFLLHYSLLEKAIYELGYELNSRPLWAIIPLKGISSILNPE